MRCSSEIIQLAHIAHQIYLAKYDNQATSNLRNGEVFQVISKPSRTVERRKFCRPVVSSVGSQY
jgi:hypothetical protein